MWRCAECGERITDHGPQAGDEQGPSSCPRRTVVTLAEHRLADLVNTMDPKLVAEPQRPDVVLAFIVRTGG
jgi:hypothetical protein